MIIEREYYTIIIGDFNSKVGIIGGANNFATDIISNENGNRMVDLALLVGGGLNIAGSYFCRRPNRKWT